MTAEQAGDAASVPSQPGFTYAWSVTNGTIMVGESTDSIAFRAGASGSVTLACKVTNSAGQSVTATAASLITPAPAAKFNLDQALTDEAQSTTLAFAGFGMMTGGLGAQYFFLPGKVADYWGFQYLRDNDPGGMGHNTSFLTRVACNVLYILSDAQLATLKNLATSQVENINLYAWKRYPLMKAASRNSHFIKPLNIKGMPVFYFTGGNSTRFESEWFENAAIKKYIRLIVPDRPGFGLSTLQPNRQLLDWPMM